MPAHKGTGALEWRQVAKAVRSAGGRLLTLWGADDRDRDGHFRVYAAYLQADGVAVVEHEMESGGKPTYPSVAEFFPSAARMERAIFDLLGIRSMEADHRGWLRHGGWPENVFPLRRDFDGRISSQFCPNRTHLSRSRATESMRFRWGPYTRAPLSPDTFDSPWSEKKFYGWRSAWATSTKELKSGLRL